MNTPKGLKNALRRAAKNAGGTMRKAIAEKTARDYFIKASKVRKATRLQADDEKIILTVSGKRLLLSSYFLTPKKRPHTRQHGIYGAVKRSGGAKYIAKGFLLKDNLPFIRFGQGPEDIEPIYSPAISQIAGNPDNLDEVIEETKEKFMKYFNHEVLYELGAFKK